MRSFSVCDDMEEAMDQKFELPPGFRFHPTDEELITHYLSQKVLDSCFCARAIGEADLNKCEPWDLPWRAKMGEKEWYFFCVRDRKYPTGLRTNRATGAGYWKATGKDKEIYRAKALIGMKKTLVFYKGRAPKGEKTNWVMHEYRLEDKHHSMHNLPKRAMNEWAICRVFEKGSCGVKKMHVPELVRFNSSFGKELPPLMDDSSPPYNNNNNSETKTIVGESSHVTCFSEDQKTQQDDNNNNIVVDSFETPPILASSSYYSSINPSSDIFSPAPIVFHQTTTQEFGNSQCSDSFVIHDQQSMLRMLVENHGYSNSTKPKIQKVQERDFDADMSSSSVMMYNNNEMFQRSFGNNNNQEYSSASSVGHVDTTSCLWNF